MSRKLALIIGNSEYQDAKLAQLVTPGEDVGDLAEILRASDIGAFDEVMTLVNESSTNIRLEVETFFAEKAPDDLLLLYFSGHGVRDDQGHLYLAVTDTRHNRLRATAIPAGFITSEMDRSRSRRQVLILDCCHSGAFAQGMKGAVGESVGTASAFAGIGYGRVVLTASDSTQYAWEGDEVIGQAENSVFTRYLTEGLRTGAADRDADGRVTLDELYDYVYEQVVSKTPRQTPGKWSYKQQGEIVIAKNPRPIQPKPIALPLELQQTIEDSRPWVREGAVRELERLLNGSVPGLARAAHEALKRLADDDSRRVAAAAAHVLAAYSEATRTKEDEARAKEEAARKEAEEKARREAEERAQREAQARAEAERIAVQKAEEERIARDAERAEAERVAREKSKQEALARERAEQVRLAREKAERERIERDAEQAEQERIARQKAEADRIAREKAEAERVAAEKAQAERVAQEKAEQDRLARDAERVEAERLAAQKAERLTREKTQPEVLARERAERERLAQARAEQAKLASEKAQPAAVSLPAVQRWSRAKMWGMALFRPSLATYEKIARDSNTGGWAAYFWVFISGIVGSLFIFIGQLLFSLLGFSTSTANPLSGPLGLTLIGVPIVAVVSTLCFGLSTAVTQFAARLLGGSGTQAKMAYVTSAYLAPLIFVVSLLSIIPIVGFLAVLLYIYGIGLLVIAVKAVNRFSWRRAIASVAVIVGLGGLAVGVLAVVVIGLLYFSSS